MAADVPKKRPQAQRANRRANIRGGEPGYEIDEQEKAWVTPINGALVKFIQSSQVDASGLSSDQRQVFYALAGLRYAIDHAKGGTEDIDTKPLREMLAEADALYLFMLGRSRHPGDRYLKYQKGAGRPRRNPVNTMRLRFAVGAALAMHALGMKKAEAFRKVLEGWPQDIAKPRPKDLENIEYSANGADQRSIQSAKARVEAFARDRTLGDIQQAVAILISEISEIGNDFNDLNNP